MTRVPQKNQERIRANHAEYFRRTYDPIKAAKERKKRMPITLNTAANLSIGPTRRNTTPSVGRRCSGRFAEAFDVLKLLKTEIKRQMPDRFERYAQAGRMQWNPINQARRRRKTYERNPINGNFLEGISLGNP